MPRSRRAGGGSGGRGGGRADRRRGGGPNRRARKSGKRRTLRWVAITLSVLILGTAGAGYAYYLYLNSNIRSDSRAGGDSGVKKGAPNALGDTPLNLLLIGSDSRADPKNVALGGSAADKDRPPLADVQMLLHISADRKNASLVSIPRDTIVPIPECRGKDGHVYRATDNQSINETLSRGGPGCTLTTWEKLTGVYIDHWMMIEFAGVVSMADEIGGVPVCVKTGVWDRPTARVRGGSNLKLKEGTSEIQGEQALQWLRTRHAWGNDQGRAKAQHMYLSGLMKKLQEQNAWTNTPRLMGLADAATKSFVVSDEIKAVDRLFDLSMQLKNVKLDRLTTTTVPTVEWSQNRDKLVMVQKSADKMWTMLREDVAFDKNGGPAEPKGDASGSGTSSGTGTGTDAGTGTGAPAAPPVTAEAPGSFKVTVVNGTGGGGQNPVKGRAKAVAGELQGKGFTQADSSQEAQPRNDTVLFYPKSAGEQGKANAVSVAQSIGLPVTSVRADDKVQGVTLVVGADWREGAYKKRVIEDGDLPEGADDKTACMDVYSVYRWDGKS